MRQVYGFVAQVDHHAISLLPQADMDCSGQVFFLRLISPGSGKNGHKTAINTL
jgi:hypothetical protein